jgi:hypothetical protein
MDKPRPKAKPSGVILNIRVSKESKAILAEYKHKGYKIADVVNYAINKLPELMEKD